VLEISIDFSQASWR